MRSPIKEIKLERLNQWLDISRQLINEFDSNASHILSKMTLNQMSVVATLVKGAYAKGYRDKAKHDHKKFK